MQAYKKQIEEIFKELNDRIVRINQERTSEGGRTVPRAKVQLLGQISLLINEKAAMVLSLAQTGDMDAFLRMEHVVRKELDELLEKRGLVYDQDSHLIWIPPKSKFELLFDFEHVLVESIDPESALVSKAVKAPEKNKQLIREAIASDGFPELVDRILENGGQLEDFV